MIKFVPKYIMFYIPGTSKRQADKQAQECRDFIARTGLTSSVHTFGPSKRQDDKHVQECANTATIFT